MHHCDNCWVPCNFIYRYIRDVWYISDLMVNQKRQEWFDRLGECVVAGLTVDLIQVITPGIVTI